MPDKPIRKIPELEPKQPSKVSLEQLLDQWATTSAESQRYPSTLAKMKPIFSALSKAIEYDSGLSPRIAQQELAHIAAWLSEMIRILETKGIDCTRLRTQLRNLFVEEKE